MQFAIFNHSLFSSPLFPFGQVRQLLELSQFATGPLFVLILLVFLVTEELYHNPFISKVQQ